MKITDAANQWIKMIQESTKATAEAKAELIAKIQAALPKVKRTTAENFIMATNEIKAVM